MILHIATRPDWAAGLAAGAYRPASLAAEGFIHCSTYAQAAATANRYFAGREDLVLLCIDEARLTAELRYEAPAGPADPRADQQFPHLYGPLAASAVVAVVDFPPGPDGRFSLPDGLP
ncbi:MAG TPA: DUF952 domain-containing protein [Kofleriaceae bacterium]